MEFLPHLRSAHIYLFSSVKKEDGQFIFLDEAHEEHYALCGVLATKRQIKENIFYCKQ